MKYIIAILLIILIVFFTMKKSIEYRKEKLEEVCDTNCGKHKTEGSCLSCENCGVCKLTRRDKIYTYCLPGDDKGALFNEECKGTAWTFKGTPSQPTTTQTRITIDNKPRTYTEPSSASSYADVLNSLGQQVDTKTTVSTFGDKIGVNTTSKEEEVKIQSTGVSISTTTKQKSYDEIIDELQKLSLYFKK